MNKCFTLLSKHRVKIVVLFFLVAFLAYNSSRSRAVVFIVEQAFLKKNFLKYSLRYRTYNGHKGIIESKIKGETEVFHTQEVQCEITSLFRLFDWFLDRSSTYGSGVDIKPETKVRWFYETGDKIELRSGDTVKLCSYTLDTRPSPGHFPPPTEITVYLKVK